MYKLYILFLFLISYTISSQESILIPNTNVDATELNHSLNKTNDSLLLSSEFTIHKVEIFNSIFAKYFETSSKNLKIPLQGIPLGRQSIAVFVNRKIIMLTLLREMPYEEKIIKPTIKEKEKPIDKNRIRDSLVKSNNEKMNRIRDSLEIANLKEIQRIKDSLERENVLFTEIQKTKPPISRETEITEYDTVRVTNILNKNHMYIEENIVNETFDTLIIGTINYKVKDKIISKRKIPYDISTKDNDFRVIKQTREDFRKYNLRPNGTPYTPDVKKPIKKKQEND